MNDLTNLTFFDTLSSSMSTILLLFITAIVLSLLYYRRERRLNKHGKAKKETHSVIDMALISQAMELLSDTKQRDSSLSMVLTMIGSYYQLDYIGIVETEEPTGMGRISYEWRLHPSIPGNSDTLIPQMDIAQLSSYNRNHEDYFVVNEITAIRPISQALYTTLLHYNVTGFLECGITTQSTETSFITCCFTTPGRVWEPHEIDTLRLLAKLLGCYLHQLEVHKNRELLQRVDPLTTCNQLPAFLEEARTILLNHPSNHYVVFFSDIDKFKLINENYGYHEGDRILLEFTKAMQSILEPGETFGRVNADKFIGLFYFDNPKQFLTKIKTLHDYMNHISSPNQSMYRISIIIGLCPVEDYSKLSLNIEQANIARKSITNRHKSRYAFFDETMKKKLMDQHEIESLMEASLQQEDFKVYYQPKFNLQTNTICGAEALVRWIHPEKGMIYPNDFIPIFEENHFILKLDLYVFEQVCKHIEKLMQLGKEIYPVSVNFSRVHLDNPGMIQKLQSILDTYHVPPHYLEIELTESALQINHVNMYSILIKLHRMGFQISMDDFGSGLSSLNLLRSLPCDILKLDKDFFQQGTSTKRERIVIRMIVMMAKELHMTIVSEGVETEEQAEFLRSIDCDIAQGYLYAKPMPENDYEQHYYDL